jgi:hypothetical protein
MILTCLGARFIAIPDTLGWVIKLAVELLEVVIESGDVALTKSLSPCGFQNLRCSKCQLWMLMFPPSHPAASRNAVLKGCPPILRISYTFILSCVGESP